MNYLGACILLGIGIAVDVALATIVMARKLDQPRARRFWVRNVTLTHVALPMIGYYGFAFLARSVPYFQIPLGLVATALVAWFLFDQLREWLGTDDMDTDGQVDFRAVLAVSWDALWSGPAKSAQALDWSASQILFSFFIAGAVVALVAAVSGSLAPRLLERLTTDKSVERQAWREVVAMWLEFSVIGFFGMLAFLRYVLASDASEPLLLLLASGLSLAILVPFARRLQAGRALQLQALRRVS
ncbi:MAG TPA: hypothetical protein VFQ67_05760 [Allosphingosinicella sp.]|jgi:hypothetical protein|nr:hypothetical protein [Allosphingosinicella sp.]